jgi:hypothetical protein
MRLGLHMDHSLLDTLRAPFSRRIFGHEGEAQKDHSRFVPDLETRLEFLLRNPANQLSLFDLGYAALEAFLQSNATGPPLDFDPKHVIFPDSYQASVPKIRKEMSAALSIQGQAIYSLVPDVELFWTARSILTKPGLCEGFNGRRARMRVNFWHQKLLPEPCDALRDQIFEDAEILQGQLSSRLVGSAADAEIHFVEYLIERAVVDIYYGDDVRARAHLARAAKVRGFHFALTGALGKRTRFQEQDLSQLVVVAKSRDIRAGETPVSERKGAVLRDSASSAAATDTAPTDGMIPAATRSTPATGVSSGPDNLLLNDDTLLESIEFASPDLALPAVVSENSDLPRELAELSLSSQPQLVPFDSVILLHLASSITNTSPSDGLTREETLPYATRVLEGGSANWQVYTHALLVRSRIEGYRSRTVERGLLQLQALVDQVIVETTAKHGAVEGVIKNGDGGIEPGTASPPAQPTLTDLVLPEFTSLPQTSFLPAASPSDSAPASERLEYIHQLHPPLRWELEAELAARWVSLGGLKSALDIYERLQMHAEVALCLAATDKEAAAILVIRKLLFKPSNEGSDDGQCYTDSELDQLPPDAPRLYCILGDFEDCPEHYARAWTISKGGYARAQRSLGRYHVRKKQFVLAADAYN